MIEKYDDLSAIDFPENPFKSPHTGDPDVYALIQSHLFCVDNLCSEQIRARLAEERKFEGNPVRYEGQRLGNLYHYWLYPNYDDSTYSKVFARINAVGDLVVCQIPRGQRVYNLQLDPPMDRYKRQKTAP